MISAPGLTLRQALIVSISLIILIVIGFLLTFTYIQAKNEIIRQDRRLEEFGEMNLAESLSLVDRGLKLFDDSLNSKMEEAFSIFLAGYREAGGDPGGMDLQALESLISRGMDGEIDLYMINESGVIIASTVPEVMNLDFRNYPEFYDSITEIRLGEDFAADRVVRSVENTSSGTVTGKLRKFAFMPSPDHRYLLEMGLVADSFETERSGLSYVDAAQRIAELNPNIQSIRIFDINRNLLLEQGAVQASNVNRTLLDEVFLLRKSVTRPDPLNNTVLKYLFVDLKSEESASDMSLVAEITYTSALLREQLEQILLFYLLIATITIMMGIAVTYSVTRYLTTPIDEIVEDVEEIAMGNLDHTIRSMPNPEFRRLESAINTMVSEIREISGELEREKAELRIASEIQRTFLPRTLPVLTNYEIAAENVPAMEVGGDFYDFIPLGEHRTGFVIADVAGKGISAALFMVLSRSIVRGIAAAEPDIQAAMEESNNLVTADAVSGMFVTLFYGVLDEMTGEMTYVNAGHNPPFHYRAGTEDIVALMPTGIVLGVDQGMKYGLGTATLSEGDVLVMYTDGVTEAFNESGEQFGEERLLQILRDANRMDARSILNSIREGAVGFTGEAPQSDDITLVVIKCRERESSQWDTRRDRSHGA
ncbi:MAG TPA: SpoIIE family protein phosphatase [Methanoregulaceae archaeon]|nr:SpoIIE family protein phosphatase [Methanoregulaceae archaeon]